MIVLWTTSHETFEEGYDICRSEHSETMFIRESRFENDVFAIVNNGYLNETVCFIMDDDVLYREITTPTPEQILQQHTDAICFSLRLGTNSTYCYPLKRNQGQPNLIIDHVADTEKDFAYWDWRTGDGDFGYPASLDGHVFRTPELAVLLSETTFKNPNSLEDALVVSTKHMLAPKMCSYRLSHLVGVPANRVSNTHVGNRYGEKNFEPEGILNRRYLEGGRIDLHSIDPKLVNAAHVEFPLKFV